MTDIHLAFAHPAARAEATADDTPLDRISVRDHVVEVDIGAFQAERGVTQRIRFNIVVEVRPLVRPIDDDVDRILSYDRVTEAITTELAAERLNLLETLAERVAERILTEPRAVRTFVRVEKLDRGPGALGVEIARGRDAEGPVEVADPASQMVEPCVVYLSNAAIAAPHLPGWIDQLQGQGRPLILCVGAAECAAPEAAHPLAQRRIDLLAIEQNAWVLAARDPRCKVVGTRTELDWAMKNNQICIWAPSKIVLDAVDGPSAKASHALALAAWFAATCEAQEILVIGADGADGAGAEGLAVPMRQARADKADLCLPNDAGL